MATAVTGYSRAIHTRYALTPRGRFALVFQGLLSDLRSSSRRDIHRPSPRRRTRSRRAPPLDLTRKFIVPALRSTPAFIQPCLALARNEVPTARGLVHELK